MNSIRDLIKMLGREGAISGLIASDLTISEITELCPSDFNAPSKIKRDDLIVRVVNHEREKLSKTPDQLIEMDSDALKAYFAEARFTKVELLELLSALDIRPGSAARNNLAEFAAREISDIGMYKRVAKGKHSS